ncbi:methyltransferase domain-containing protein [Mycolicibacterium arseniciresistens]|uniref:Methyltransferase domain-containing protein n=1 Tax=Mycolicibacterium arseniciresistens TaxID=3062257 RepID=A0ABT8UEC9_9MYCO|nr:methyltransferase domain-containing protein [Mycolicibacterium arseniciresistens]MDO3636141.1 methyltransferase domain-containing protein [Mycolicibacterium arseniciresistens]
MAQKLLVDPPVNPRIDGGYLDLLSDDLLGDTGGDAPERNTGTIQAVWASRLGSMVYDNSQLVVRRLVTSWQLPIDWLSLPVGGVALDVGSGPGNVTAALGRAAGPGGLALGVDISEPMLARAVRAEAGPNVGFVRADAQRLPFRDESVDAVVSMAMLQLIPDPPVALAEMVRVLRPGRRMAVMVPTAGPAARLIGVLPNAGARVFDDDEIGDTLESLGVVGVRTKTIGTIQWVRGRRP